MHSFLGDSGLFRSALLLSGFFERSECMIFNDNNKDGTRRLKLWFADAVFYSPQEQQLVLEHWLREVFGARIVEMYFADSSARYGNYSFCIKLED